ncbi:MAG: DUF255 domain-containing protein [Saprospiraceae bacterium]|nr:DUF255 domain-containing protein [Saprospiraceae bacterium]
MRFTLFSIFLCCSLVVLGQGQDIQFFDNDLSGAIQQAQQEDKLIFVHGNATWCVPCRLMEEEVFIYPEVYSFFNEHFVNLSLDLEKGIGPILAARYQANVLPYFMFLTSDETLVHAFHGFQSIDNLLARAKESMTEERKLTAWERRFEDGDRKPAFLYNYAFAIYPSSDGSHQKILDAFMEANPDPLSEMGIRFAYNFMQEVDSELFYLMVDNQEEFARVIGQEKISRTIDLMVEQALQDKSTAVEEGIKLLQRAYPADGQCRSIKYEIAKRGETVIDETARLTLALKEASVCGSGMEEFRVLGEAMLSNPNLDEDLLRQYNKLLVQHQSEVGTDINFHMLRGQLSEQLGDLGGSMERYREGLRLAKTSKNKVMRRGFKDAIKRIKRKGKRQKG